MVNQRSRYLTPRETHHTFIMLIIPHLLNIHRVYFSVVSINLTLSYHPPRLPLVDSCVLLISSCLLLVGRPCGLASLAMSRINQRDFLVYLQLSLLISIIVKCCIPCPPVNVFFLQVPFTPTYPTITFSYYSFLTTKPIPPPPPSGPIHGQLSDSLLSGRSYQSTYAITSNKDFTSAFVLADIWVNESDLSFSFFFYPLLCPSFLYEIHIYQ
jgi:hypothetical protein